MLASDVYLPSEGQRFPTVLIRTLMVNQEGWKDITALSREAMQW